MDYGLWIWIMGYGYGLWIMNMDMDMNMNRANILYDSKGYERMVSVVI